MLKRGLDNPGCLAFFEALVDGRLRLGQTITKEELCEVLGLTMSRMRDVVILLQAEGLLEPRKRVGLTIFYPDVRFVGGTFQFREILECEGLRRFTEMVTDEWLDRMNLLHDEMISFLRENPDVQVYAEPMRKLEREFHDSFVGALGNDIISMNHRRNAQKMYLLRLMNPDSVGPSNSIQSMVEHVDVIRALEKRDTPAAVAALQRHMKGVLHRVLTH